VETTATRLRRRVRTVPTHVLLLVVGVVLAPILFAAALLVDLIRRVATGKPFMAVRLLAFGLLYIIVGNICLVVLLGQWVAAGFGSSSRRMREGSYRLQEWWANTLFTSVRWLFRLRVEVGGLDAVSPGPVIVLMRHASIIDTLIPNVLITRGAGIRLRYVLKKELLADPALDIAGNRLVNHFVDRGGDSRAEIRAVAALADGMTASEGVIIYPEGTRFTEARRQRLLDGGGTTAERAKGLGRVLPPRPGGSTALLGSGHDVVVVAHTGLEPLATIPDAWSGRIIDSRLRVAVWRHPAASVPGGRAARVEWLYERWREVDEWIAG
jgi:1-acyl-sn-glycerol-3-phosphate acyltransferase